VKWSQLVEKNEIKQNKQAKQTNTQKTRKHNEATRETQGEGYHSNG